MAINVGDLVANLRLDMSGFAAGIARAQAQADSLGTSMQSAGRKMTSAGKGLTAGVTAPIVGLGAAAFKTAADFEGSMNRVKAVIGDAATETGMADLTEEAKALGATTVFSAKEAADGMAFLAQAGFKTDEILSAMGGTLDLAAAGQLDLARAADISSNVLSGFGLGAGEANRAADVLAKTASSANTSVEQMGEAMSFVAPVAASAGLEMEQVASAVGILGNAGIQGSRAGTTLSNAITKLLKPSNTAAKVIEELGLQVQDSEGKMLPFDKIVKQLGDSGATTAQLMEIFGLRAGPGMAALVGQGADSIETLNGVLNGAEGAAGKMADTMMEGAAGAMARMKAAAEAVMIAIGDSGLLHAVTGVVEKVSEFLTRLSKTNPTLMKMGLIAAAVAAAIGPLLIIAGLVVQALGALASAAAVVTVPMLAIPAAIAAIVAGLVWLWNTNEGFRDAITSAWNEIVGVFQPVIDAVQKFRDLMGKGLSLEQIQRVGPMMGAAGEGAARLASVLARVRDAFTFLKEGATALLGALSGDFGSMNTVIEMFGHGTAEAMNRVRMFFSGMAEAVGVVLGIVAGAIRTFIGKAAGWWDRWGGDIMSFAKEAFDTVMGIISSALDAVMAVIEVFTDVAEALWRTWGDAIIGFAQRAFDIVANVIENAWNTIKQVFRGATTLVMGIFETFAGLFTGDWSRMWDGIKDIFVGAWQVLEGIVGGIFDTIIDVISGAVAGVAGVVGNVIAAITRPFVQAGGRVLDAIGGILSGIKDAFFRFVGTMFSIGGDIIGGLISGIRNAVGGAVDAVVGAVRSVKDSAMSFLGIASPSKEFAEIGKWTMRGLAEGIKRNSEEGAREVVKVAQNLVSKASDLTPKMRMVAKSSAGWTEILEKKLDKVNDRISDAKSKVDDLRRAHSQMESSVASGFSRSVFGDTQREESLLDSLRSQVDVAREFRAKLAKVQALGASDELVKRLGEAGPDALGDLDELLAGGAAAVKSASRLQQMVLDTSSDIGNRVADQMFNAGIATAEGLLAGLESKEGAIIDRLGDFAEWISNTVKSELGISSPSKVFKGFGRNLGEGMAIGIADRASDAASAAQAMARRTAQAGSATMTPTIEPRFRLRDASVSGALMDSALGRGSQSRPERRANIVVELDGRQIVRAIGEPLVDEIRLRGGVRNA